MGPGEFGLRDGRECPANLLIQFERQQGLQ